MSEPRYTIRDDVDLSKAHGLEPSDWVDILDRGQPWGAMYRGTLAENQERARLIADLLNAHDAAAINAVLARHRDLAGANGRPEGGA